jgi:hypothetical protein
MRKFLTFFIGILVCAAQASAQGQEFSARSESVIESSTLAETTPNGLSANEIKGKIAEAQTLLKSQAGLSNVNTVRLAVLAPDSAQIEFLSVPKDSFLVKNSDFLATSTNGRTHRLRIVRANGVNTAVTVTDTTTGAALLPLVVQFPIAKNGTLKETALYTSAHPALISTEVVASGQEYITSMLAQAAAQLAQNGIRVDPEIITIAEHLVIVEHTDHQRFLKEDAKTLFPEILSLYALNQHNTYNYSVSTAGAGGMIQMIPRTYEAIREQHPGVGLEPDFVNGMRNHANALKAMLLYMTDTWNKLQESSEVQIALRDAIASKPELLAAGYNSNPVRLPGYLKKGGAGWRSLIPSETQMYLAIYRSVDSNVEFKAAAPAEDASTIESTPTPRGVMSVLFLWAASGFFGK